MKKYIKIWIEFWQKDWKETRWWLVGEVVVGSWFSIVAIDSIRMGIKYDNSVYFLVAFWQFLYGVVFVSWCEIYKLLKESQKIIREVLDLCAEIIKRK